LRPPEVRELSWRDPRLAEIDAPRMAMRLTVGVGSGLTRRTGDPPGRVWGLGDRGPNLKIDLAVKRYGLTSLDRLADRDGAKVLPIPDLPPFLAELQVGRRRVRLVRLLPLAGPDGPLSGRAIPLGPAGALEPVYDLRGCVLPADPWGVDPEGLAALADGGFWVSEEYGPSLLRVDAAGRVLTRWTPPGLSLPLGEGRLPVAALRRRLNRGFEALAISGDERRLHLAFQSGLADAPQGAAPIWTLDAASGELVAEHLYPFDPPETFVADVRRGPVGSDDLKVCELVWLAPQRLLVLERMRWSSRLYRVDLGRKRRLDKTLVFSSDNHADFAPDVEGATLLSDRELLLATDNDFGVEGAATRFYRLTYDAPLAS
jgi:hypothetical protein